MCTPRARPDAPRLTYYLGTPRVNWLWSGRVHVPLMISRRRLNEYAKFRKAVVPYAIDSSAFGELGMFGAWLTSPLEFLREVEHWVAEIGDPDFIASQDWLCTIEALKATGLSVREHQARSAGSYFELMGLAPEFPWLPVLHGLTGDDYLRHADFYQSCGVDLAALPLVGIGGIATRQDDPGIVAAIKRLAASAIRLHGFGVKRTGLALYRESLATADSQAWSYEARMAYTQPGFVRPAVCKSKGHCGQCVHRALDWLEETYEIIDRPADESRQAALWTPAETDADATPGVREFLELQGAAPDQVAGGVTSLLHLEVALAMRDAELDRVRFLKGDTDRANWAQEPPSVFHVAENLSLIREALPAVRAAAAHFNRTAPPSDAAEAFLHGKRPARDYPMWQAEGMGRRAGARPDAGA